MIGRVGVERGVSIPIGGSKTILIFVLPEPGARWLRSGTLLVFSCSGGLVLLRLSMIGEYGAALDAGCQLGAGCRVN